MTLMPTQAEVHAAAQALWDAAKKLPESHDLRRNVELAVTVPCRFDEQFLSANTPCPACGLVCKPDEQFVGPEHRRLLRPYDEADPAESFAWCGRLLPVTLAISDPAIMQGNAVITLDDAIDHGYVLEALDAARRAVEGTAMAKP